MAPVTLSRISTVTVGAGGAANITFTNIPQIYTDLKIVMSGRTTGAGQSGQYISFNGSTSNFSGIYLYGDGTSTSSGTLARYAGTVAGTNLTASVFNNTEIYIPNYTSSNHKSFSVDNVAENNATYGGQNFISGIWADVSPITSISIAPDNGSYPQYSTATLYGIKSLERSAYASGGEVSEIGGYYIHTFKGNGTFTPTVPLSVEYLVVAGGGGGGEATAGGSSGGGGGAGGVRCTFEATGGGGSVEPALSLNAQAYTVTVGSGGARGGSFGTKGNNGENSVFGSIVAIGGGGGGSSTSGGTGGSGGGESYADSGAGSGTSNQGYAGGTIISSPANFPGAGGGGAGAVGSNSTSTAGGSGGAGITTSISGASTTYGGGGGGGVYNNTSGNAGSGGSGGGGRGAYQNVSAVAGTDNTGGGGGGGSRQVGGNIITAAAGGSGIVIIRYRK